MRSNWSRYPAKVEWQKTYPHTFGRIKSKRKPIIYRCLKVFGKWIHHFAVNQQKLFAIKRGHLAWKFSKVANRVEFGLDCCVLSWNQGRILPTPVPMTMLMISANNWLCTKVILVIYLSSMEICRLYLKLLFCLWKVEGGKFPKCDPELLVR